MLTDCVAGPGVGSVLAAEAKGARREEAERGGREATSREEARGGGEEVEEVGGEGKEAGEMSGRQRGDTERGNQLERVKAEGGGEETRNGGVKSGGGEGVEMMPIEGSGTAGEGMSGR